MDWSQDVQDGLKKEQDRQDIQDEKLKYSWITDLILKSCFEIMGSLGVGFLESVYKNALRISLIEKGLDVLTEKLFEVTFKGKSVGIYYADLIIENTVLAELKCCKTLLPEHQAQTINYLKASNLPIGLLLNFGNAKIEYKRLYHPSYPVYPAYPVHPVPFSTHPVHPVGVE